MPGFHVYWKLPYKRSQPALHTLSYSMWLDSCGSMDLKLKDKIRDKQATNRSTQNDRKKVLPD